MENAELLDRIDTADGFATSILFAVIDTVLNTLQHSLLQTLGIVESLQKTGVRDVDVLISVLDSFVETAACVLVDIITSLVNRMIDFVRDLILSLLAGLKLGLNLAELFTNSIHF